MISIQLVPLPQDVAVETRATGASHDVLAVAIDVAAQLGKYEVVTLEYLQTQPRQLDRAPLREAPAIEPNEVESLNAGDHS